LIACDSATRTETAEEVVSSGRVPFVPPPVHDTDQVTVARIEKRFPEEFADDRR
jgi:hypothetical protein